MSFIDFITENDVTYSMPLGPNDGNGDPAARPKCPPDIPITCIPDKNEAMPPCLVAENTRCIRGLGETTCGFDDWGGCGVGDLDLCDIEEVYVCTFFNENGTGGGLGGCLVIEPCGFFEHV